MQSINFEQLRPYWPDLASLGGHAEKYVFDDPQSALVKLRCFAEQMVGIIYREFRLPSQPTDKFVDRLQAAVFTSAVDKSKNNEEFRSLVMMASPVNESR